MNYKKIFKNQVFRFRLLALFDFVPDNIMVRIQYRIHMGRPLNLKNPKRLSEKIQKYKLEYRNPDMLKCVDKYEVREYIESKGLGHLLNELYGVYDDVEDIDFESLPNQFVMKLTGGSGGFNVIICKDKEKFDIEDAKRKINYWIKSGVSKKGREWVYYSIKPRIIVEEFLLNDRNKGATIDDYKFYCSNGKVNFVVVLIDRFVHMRKNFYNNKWEKLPVKDPSHPNFDVDVLNEEQRKELVDIAETLAKDFPFVRVDLYYTNNRVVFGELTFYPASGYNHVEPEEYDLNLGKLIDIY